MGASQKGSRVGEETGDTDGAAPHGALGSLVKGVSLVPRTRENQ